jgi:hypothetical protein
MHIFVAVSKTAASLGRSAKRRSAPCIHAQQDGSWQNAGAATLSTMGFWGLVWLALAIRKGERRKLISVDEWGNSRVRRPAPQVGSGSYTPSF